MPVQPTTQFSVFLVNKPGVLAQVTKSLANARINIVAMTLVDSQEHGVLRMVVDNPGSAHKVLKELNLPTSESEVLTLEMNNRPGALADVAGLLAKNHINISYAYVSSGAPGGRTTAIVKVNDAKKAQVVLRDNSPKHREPDLHRGSQRR